MDEKIFEIIPAIDLIDGKCVRLVEGRFDAVTEYATDPIDQAKRFEDWGLKRLHFVDLDGAREGSFKQYKLLEHICTQTGLKVDVGGGMYTDEDAKKAFESGASMISAGTIAVENKDQVARWLTTYGPEKIILGMDVKDEKIQIKAWTGESEVTWQDFLKEYLELGITHIISTDVFKDGKLAGPSFYLYEDILEMAPDIQLIGSGGIRAIDDVEELMDMGLSGVVIGKAIYMGTVTEKDIVNFYSNL